MYFTYMYNLQMHSTLYKNMTGSGISVVKSQYEVEYSGVSLNSIESFYSIGAALVSTHFGSHPRPHQLSHLKVTRLT